MLGVLILQKNATDFMSVAFNLPRCLKLIIDNSILICSRDNDNYKL